MSLTKVVALFLVVIAVLAMFGKLRMPRLPGMRRGAGRLGATARRCGRCGRHLIGAECPCGGNDRGAA